MLARTTCCPMLAETLASVLVAETLVSVLLVCAKNNLLGKRRRVCFVQFAGSLVRDQSRMINEAMICLIIAADRMKL